jgi:hypothetical protein
MLKKILTALGVVLLLGAVAFVDYGVKTQCPDVAIYVKCYDY